MIQQFSRFIRSGPGLEKTLRLIQAVSQVAAVLSVGRVAVSWTKAKLQLALTRRFFRFFNFIPSFQRVAALLGQEGIDSVPAWIELAKWTCFGLYFVLEDFTILHAMGVYPVAWNDRALHEANQFWFYALSLSLAGTLWGLLFPAVEHNPSLQQTRDQKNQQQTGSEKAVSAAQRSTPSRPLLKQIVVDGCDLLIPGSLLGWIPSGDLAVGLGIVISTLLTGQEIWVAQQMSNRL